MGEKEAAIDRSDFCGKDTQETGGCAPFHIP